eukprot:s3057_g12.t1
MMQAAGHNDVNLVSDIQNGFDLLVASLSVDDVRIATPANQRAIWEATKSCRDLDVAAEVYRLTLEERDRGWLTGPFALGDVPATAVVTRRFGVKQGMTTSSSEAVAKIRPIDDFTESLANRLLRSVMWIVCVLRGRHSCKNNASYAEEATNAGISTLQRVQSSFNTRWLEYAQPWARGTIPRPLMAEMEVEMQMQSFFARIRNGVTTRRRRTRRKIGQARPPRQRMQTARAKGIGGAAEQQGQATAVGRDRSVLPASRWCQMRRRPRA